MSRNQLISKYTLWLTSTFHPVLSHIQAVHLKNSNSTPKWRIFTFLYEESCLSVPVDDFVEDKPSNSLRKWTNHTITCPRLMVSSLTWSSKSVTMIITTGNLKKCDLVWFWSTSLPSWSNRAVNSPEELTGFSFMNLKNVELSFTISFQSGKFSGYCWKIIMFSVVNSRWKSSAVPPLRKELLMRSIRIQTNVGGFSWTLKDFEYLLSGNHRWDQFSSGFTITHLVPTSSDCYDRQTQ